jgi:hypothetical protein
MRAKSEVNPENRTDDNPPVSTHKGGKFEPGKSGNPGGRPKGVQHIRELARQYTTEAIETLVEIMNDKEAPHSARAQCAFGLIDRGYGKPTQMVMNVDDEGNYVPPVADPLEIARRMAFHIRKIAEEELAKQTQH